MAVNVSARSLVDPQFPAIISDRLATAGVPANLLTIELTEGNVMAYLKNLPLKSIRVDIAEGYHIGHPMPENLVRHWIESRPTTLSPNADTHEVQASRDLPTFRPC